MRGEKEYLSMRKGFPFYLFPTKRKVVAATTMWRMADLLFPFYLFPTKRKVCR